jgi:hypothetical protein
MAVDPDLFARLAEIGTGGYSHPERPPGVDPKAMWEVPVGTVLLRTHNPDAEAINELRLLHPGRLMPPDYRPQLEPAWTERALTCPECDSDRELVVTGRWGEPAVVRCLSGHRWTPVSHNPDWGIALLKTAITSTPEAHRR